MLQRDGVDIWCERESDRVCTHLNNYITTGDQCVVARGGHINTLLNEDSPRYRGENEITVVLINVKGPN